MWSLIHLCKEAVWSGQTLNFFFTHLGSVWFLRMGGVKQSRIYWTKSLIRLLEPTQKSSQPSSKGLFWHQLVIWHISKSYNKPFFYHQALLIHVFLKSIKKNTHKAWWYSFFYRLSTTSASTTIDPWDYPCRVLYTSHFPQLKHFTKTKNLFFQTFRPSKTPPSPASLASRHDVQEAKVLPPRCQIPNHCLASHQHLATRYEPCPVGFCKNPKKGPQNMWPSQFWLRRFRTQGFRGKQNKSLRIKNLWLKKTLDQLKITKHLSTKTLWNH